MSVDVAMVLQLSGELQRSTTLADVVRAAQRAVTRATRYRNTWLMALEDTAEGGWFRILALEGQMTELIWERAPRFPVGNDPFLLEILQADHPVIVDDMRVDPRTDKEIVARTDHRTGITVPMRIGESSLGGLCVGTFGKEGVVAPSPDEIEKLTVVASLVAAAFDRVRLLAQKNASEEQARALTDKTQGLVEQLHHLQRLEAVGQLAGGIAHDFNNLLMAIAGHAELALEDADPKGSIAESLEVVLEATKRGSYLTHNLLSFSRKRVLTRRVCELNEVVRGAYELIRPALRAEIDFRFTPSTEPLWVSLDEFELEHVLVNLITNARDSISGAGKIELAVTSQLLDDEFIALHEGRLVGESAVVSIADTGSGMDEATRERIFEPFFSTKGSGKGTGLGLATVHSIVRQLGGVIALKTELGRGTEFQLYWPPTTPNPAQVGEGLQPSTPQMGGRGPKGTETILLADDDDLVRALLLRVLLGQGYHVLEADDGQTAIELFRQESANIDLVLTDLMMPRRSGLELVDAILAFKQGTPIVVMSGYTSDPEGAARIGGLGLPILNKPTTPTEVLGEVRRALAAGRARKQRSN